jgi:2-polyprenyl-3-methyl-5-hydroxy-6-metoxy-1,4-benzoquinol methylase
MNNQDHVTRFFKGYAQQFTNIYTHDNKNTINKLIDIFLRKSMFSRFNLAKSIFKECQISNLLDVGCGPGVHDLILASELKINITGIDVAPEMIEIAVRSFQELKIHTPYNFIVGDFKFFSNQHQFDAALSLGVLEYVDDPKFFIKKIFNTVAVVACFSLPKKYHILTPQRSLRYRIRKCPLWFYTRSSIQKMLVDCEINKYKIHDLGRDYLVAIYR